ncbi:MAG: transcriptional regulator [Methanomicrobiales archaeon]|nr:transcriptional regulator [Methanomicrobiales archaeon]
MSQQKLLQMVVSVLIMGGYQVSERFDMRPRSFDLIARHDEMPLVIKVVTHIDSVTEDIAHDLALIARCLKGKPLIVGERARDTGLERGAIYLRYGIVAVNVSTLYDYLVERIPPLVYASPGGLYVNINGDLLRELREQHQLSLGDLAHVLGVSRRTISKYEGGMGTTLDIAVRLEELFDTAIVEAIDLLSYESPVEHRFPPQNASVPPDLERMGMTMHAMQRAPFQALVQFREELILTGYGPAQKVVRRAAIIGNISEIAKTRAMCVITDYNKQKKVGKTLIIGEKQLHFLEDGSELIELIDK